MYANTNNWFLNMYLFMRHFLSSSKGNVVAFLVLLVLLLQPLPICVVSLMLCASHFIPFGVLLLLFFFPSSILFSVTSSSAVYLFIFFAHTNVFLSVFVCESWVHSEPLHCIANVNCLSCFSFRLFFFSSSFFSLLDGTNVQFEMSRQKQWHRFRSDSVG